MKQTKFRIWNTINNAWLPSEITDRWELRMLNEHSDYIQQFTRAYDSTGKEIYEGDIVKQNFQTEMGSFAEGLGTIEFCMSHFAFEAAQGSTDDRRGYTIGGTCQIVGNIYENPELVPHEKV